MSSGFSIRPLEADDIALVTDWARNEGFCPGEGDVDIYRQTDRQGLWVGCLEGEPIGCLAGVRWGNRRAQAWARSMPVAMPSRQHNDCSSIAMALERATIQSNW